jgi:hypothetical protein
MLAQQATSTLCVLSNHVPLAVRGHWQHIECLQNAPRREWAVPTELASLRLQWLAKVT